MKNPYNDIRREYEKESYLIDNLYSDIEYAMESTGNSSNLMQQISEKITKLFNELLGILDRRFSNIYAYLTRFLETDEGFQKEIRTAIQKKNPLEGVKLVAYNYDDQFLDTMMKKITDASIKILGTVSASNNNINNNDNTPMNMNSSDLIKYILNEIGCPKEVTSGNVLFSYLKTKYRREKKSQLFVGSKTREYYNIALHGEKLKSEVVMRKTIMKQQTNTLKAQVMSIVKKADVPDNIKAKTANQIANATHVYNLFASFVDAYAQLKTEEYLTYRIVLKKLYCL